ncbi:MAG: AmmeMemoRadiSam system protein B [candidate division Zixibacteria bacterium]|nr:AmmeMemoRadiSam system protein B [candidate division Zixibacteria bacterium]
MSTEIRQPAVAGSFYPGEPSELAKMIAQMMSQVDKPSIAGDIVGLVAPHAGYIYSGLVASYAYKTIQGMEYKDVIVIGPSHAEAFSGAAVYNGDAYQTPLGIININKELSRKIASNSKLVQLSDKGHHLTTRGGEHSLEVQLPFLQTVLGNFELTAIVMGSQDMQTCRGLAESIFEACKGRKDVLIVASSDLSHFHSYDTAIALDSRVADLINSYDYIQLHKELEENKIEACGGGPIVTAMAVSEMMGAGTAKVVKYANSGDVSGDKSSVVGYLSAVFSKETIVKKVYEINEEAQSEKIEDGDNDVEINPASAVDFGLSNDEKMLLLNLSREAIRAVFSKNQFELDESEYSGVLAEERGAFVTLTIGGQLRGCIGYIKAVKPLYQTIAEMAVQAAFHDPRFRPLTESEFESVDIEISVLTPMTLVEDPNTVVVGRDGLYIIRGYNSGLLLPQVPVEQGWDKETFLNQTCLKAGLPSGTWKEAGTQIYRFQADIFGGE